MTHLSGGVTATKLVLIAKVSHAQQASDFVPILCCSVLYKCVTTLLCSVLKIVLPDLVNESKGALVQQT